MNNSQQQKLNIAMACDPITDYIAGVFTSTLRFSEQLQKRGHRIVYLAAKSPYNKDIDNYQNTKVYKFRSILIPKTENRFRFALPTVSEVETVFKKEKIDILHILLPTPLAFISIRAARKLGIKVAIHSHAQPENTTESIPVYLGKHIVKFFLSSYFSWLYKQADYLIYPTQFAQDIFSKHNNIIQNTVISNGVDTSIFIKTETDSLFTKYNLPRNTKNILFVGRLHPEKNIETLIKSIPSVLEKNANTHLYIVGPGFQKDELRKLTTKLKLDKNITFFGKVTNEELLMAYNSCDVFILPSIAELEGMVVLEAMSCGKPIIIANSKSSASRFFVNENGFLFETKDYQDLADKISTILDDDNLRENMGRKSLDLSRGYDIQRSIDKLENVYYSLIKNNI